MQEVTGSIPGQEAKIPHGSGPKNQNINRSNIVTNSIKTLQMVTLKKNLKNTIVKKSMYICQLYVLVSQSCLTLCAPWTVARQAPLSTEFSRQENWSGLLFPSPGDLPDWGPNLGLLRWQADSLLSEPPGIKN